MTPKEAVTMCLHGTIGGLLVGWAVGSRDWMYGIAIPSPSPSPSPLGVAELAMMLVGSLLLIRISRWLIRNMAALNNSN
jgi:hypothetical protein